MPSTNQGSNRTERLRCPTLKDDIGEDPARWLDADMLANPDRKELVWSLIHGIDTYARLRAWRAVELKLANDDENGDARNPLDEPRSAILKRLNQREEWLDLHGERPDRLPIGPRESCGCCDSDEFVTAEELRERDRQESAHRTKGYDTGSVDTTKTSPETQAVKLGEFATDGGEPE